MSHNSELTEHARLIAGNEKEIKTNHLSYVPTKEMRDLIDRVLGAGMRRIYFMDYLFSSSPAEAFIYEYLKTK